MRQAFGFGCILSATFMNTTIPLTWWHHQMEIFSALLAICEGNPSVTGGFTSQRPVTRSFGVFFNLHLNQRLSKQPRLWWQGTPFRSLWHHCNEFRVYEYQITLYYQRNLEPSISSRGYIRIQLIKHPHVSYVGTRNIFNLEKMW